MKKLSFLLILAAFIGACQGDTDGVKELKGGSNADLIRNPATADMSLDTNQLARMIFEEKEYNFGEIKEGDVVEHHFKFKNTGKVPLTILNARSSCGCTTPEWPKDPIPPGGTGEILARFNSEGRTGPQSKLVMVTANTFPNEISVKIKGTVKE